MFGDKYDYLRLSLQKVSQIALSEDQIKTGEDQNAIRKIFYNQEFEEFEKLSLKQLKDLAKSKNIELKFNDQTMLRFLYGKKFNLEQTLNLLVNQKTWVEDPQTFKMSEQVIDYLEKGIIYIFGRDKQMRPAMVIQAFKMDPKKFDEPSFIAGLNIVFSIVEQYMFEPGKVENWVIIIDINDQTLTKIPFDIYKRIISMTQDHFPGNLEKIYIINPSTSLNLFWSIILSFIDTSVQQKIVTLQNQQKSQLQESFQAESLEQKFGGTLENISIYWPPLQQLSFQNNSVQYNDMDLKRRFSNQNQEQYLNEPLKVSSRGNLQQSSEYRQLPPAREQLSEMPRMYNSIPMDYTNLEGNNSGLIDYKQVTRSYRSQVKSINLYFDYDEPCPQFPTFNHKEVEIQYLSEQQEEERKSDITQSPFPVERKYNTVPVNLNPQAQSNLRQADSERFSFQEPKGLNAPNSNDTYVACHIF